MSNLDKLITKYNAKLPRYTSYPTSPHFHENLSQEDVKKWYANLTNTQSLSLYIHIPFCRDICWYCGCHTKATKKDEPILRYLENLKKEIRYISSLILHLPQVSHLHFGGGSPSIISAEAFEDLMSWIQNYFSFSKEAEIAIEIDPRYVTEEKVIAYKKKGVNRVSLGVQDFNHKTQIAINRVQPFPIVSDVVRLFKKYEIDAINFDLIYGLPFQTEDSFKETIDYTCRLNPQRIALFGYAHVPHMKKHMRLIEPSSLPTPAQRITLFNQASQELSNSGYIPIGIDHFAANNDPMLKALEEKKLHRNFQGYTVDQANALIGFGVSAISHLPEGYLQNTMTVNNYENSLYENKVPFQKGIRLSNDDLCRKYIIERLMCDLEVNIDNVSKEFPNLSLDFSQQFKDLRDLEQDGLISIHKSTVKINKNTRQIVRKVCSLFDQYYHSQQQLHSQIA